MSTDYYLVDHTKQVYLWLTDNKGGSYTSPEDWAAAWKLFLLAVQYDVTHIQIADENAMLEWGPDYHYIRLDGSTVIGDRPRRVKSQMGA